MKRKVSCGEGWTALSAECWLRDSCHGCVYHRYCKEKYLIKEVIEQLLEKFGEPSEKIVDMVIDQEKRPFFVKLEKFELLEYYDNMEDF